MQFIVLPPTIVGEKMLLERLPTVIADLLKDLSAEAALGVLAQNGTIVERIQTGTRRFVCRLDGWLGFAVDNAERHRVEVGSHAVHAETNNTEILLAPVEGPVPVALPLASTVVGTAHVAQEMSTRNAHESDFILELMPQT